MLTKIEDLKKGDEFMIAQGAKLVFAKLIREPSLRWKKDATGVRVPVLSMRGNRQGMQIYSSVKCAVKIKTCTRPRSYGTGPDPTWKEYDNTLEEYNDEKYFNLNSRDIWLIEK